MKEKSIEKKHHKTFEEIKYIGSDGSEFWMARQLSKILEYAEFRNFLPVIERAKKACENSGQQSGDHFVEIHEMIALGKGGKREMASFALSRYACYLIVQNGDPSKPVIANGQTYSVPPRQKRNFAVKKLREKAKPTEPILKLVKKYARLLKNWEELCLKSFPIQKRI